MDIGEDALTRAHAEGDNGAEKVSILIRHLVDNMSGDLGDVAVLTEVETLQPNYRKLSQKWRDAFDRGFRSILEEGIADGSVRNCDVRMAGFWAIGAVNWIPKWFSPGSELSASEMAEMYAQFVIVSVGANGHRND